MSSYYELMWRDDELTSYTTDKLNFIYNAIDHPLSVRYRQLYPNRLDWQKAVNRHNAAIQKVKDLLIERKDSHNIREAWLKLHPNARTKANNGFTVEQLANKFPYMAKQLGAFMEIENIEIKYFDGEFKPRYDLDDFSDIFSANYPASGFTQSGITQEVLLKLYPNISAKNLDQILKMADCEFDQENSTEVIPYWYAVNAKRMLVDGDSFAATFDD